VIASNFLEVKNAVVRFVFDETRAQFERLEFSHSATCWISQCIVVAEGIPNVCRRNQQDYNMKHPCRAYKTLVTIFTTCFNTGKFRILLHTVYLWVLCDSQDKRWLFTEKLILSPNEDCLLWGTNWILNTANIFHAPKGYPWSSSAL
jgi:hypothetical protein